LLAYCCRVLIALL